MLIFYCTWIVNHAFNILFNIISLGSIKNVIPLKMQGFPLSKFWSKDNVYSKKENSSDLVLWNKWRFQKRICLDLHMMMAPFIKKQSTVLRKIYTKVLGLSVKMCAFQCMYSFFFFGGHLDNQTIWMAESTFKFCGVPHLAKTTLMCN